MDATRTSCVARYANDASEEYSKYVMKKIMINGILKLALGAKQNIQSNMELRYSYCLENVIFGHLLLPVNCPVPRLMHCKKQGVLYVEIL